MSGGGVCSGRVCLDSGVCLGGCVWWKCVFREGVPDGGMCLVRVCVVVCV